jgi:hypothetical protein
MSAHKKGKSPRKATHIELAHGTISNRDNVRWREND